MERWEPWVRAYMAVGEMMQGINFQKTATGNAFQVLSSGASLIAEIERPQQATFEKQIPMVLSWAELRNERATEILAQIDPQYAFWSSIVYMHPDRTRRTFELINMVLQFCVYVEMRFKHALGCYRPVEYNAQVQPMITTPGHGTFPMGHATQAYAVAHVLKAAAPARSGEHRHTRRVIDQLDRRRHASRPIVSLRESISRSTAWQDACWAWRWASTSSGVAQGRSETFMSRKFIAAGIDSAATTDFNPFTAASTHDAACARSSARAVYLLKHVWRKACDALIGDL